MRASHWFRVAIAACTLLAGQAWAAGQVNIYSARQEGLIKPILDRFSAETGITVNLVSGRDDALIERLRAEGHNSPADLFLTADAGRLYRAKAAGLLQPIRSALLESVIPENYRDPEHTWYGLSLRARVLVYAKDRVKPEQLSTYEALAAPEWKGRLCSRSSDNIYTQSLVAALIAHDGVEAVETWAKAVVANFARPPAGGDRDQIQAVAAGVCDVAISNTYYLGGMIASKVEADRQAAAQVTVFFPNQNDRGAHVNVSGGGVTHAAKNRDNAIRLLEFLVSDEAQSWYALGNNEYPVKAGVALNDTLESWGEFKADNLNLSVLGTNNAEAAKLLDRAGWK